MQSSAASPGEFDWTPVGVQVTLTASQGTGGATSTLLSSRAPSRSRRCWPGTKYQLQVAEIEVFVCDAEAQFPGSQTVQNYPAGRFPAFNALSSAPVIKVNPTTSRVVFSDVYPVSY